jgi:hypothetical protein
MDYTPWLKNSLGELPPCTFGVPLIEWANDATVREQLHIPDYVQAWDMCEGDIDYTINPEGSQWVWERHQNAYRMLKFSGDMDGAVPTSGTRNWIKSMNRDVLEAYRPWYVGGQVAGYLEEQDGLTFLTVHAAGHMVPQDQRERAHVMVNSWVRNETLPSTPN